MGTKDEWNKDCSRGNSVYRDYIWVRSEKERISLFLSLSNKEFIFISFYGKLIVCILAGVAVAEYILATIIYRYLCKKM